MRTRPRLHRWDAPPGRSLGSSGSVWGFAISRVEPPGESRHRDDLPQEEPERFSVEPTKYIEFDYVYTPLSRFAF